MTDYVKRLLKADLANAEDNLYRARLAAKSTDPAKPFGFSGKSLNEVIAGYENWRDEARKNLTEVENES